MKNHIVGIIATKNNIKFKLLDGKETNFMDYIEAVNYAFEFQILQIRTIPIEPEDLIIPETDLNAIRLKINVYFHVIFGYVVNWNLDIKNGFVGFGVYGKSIMTLNKFR